MSRQALTRAVVSTTVMDEPWYLNYNVSLKVRLRWFGADSVKLQYLCHFSCDLNVLYVK